MYDEEAISTAIECVRRTIHFPKLKPEQSKIVHELVCGNNCFVVLPTGFGKSVGFYLPPLVLNNLNPEKRHLSVVVSPLKSLIFNQKEVLTEMGVKCVALGGDISAKDLTEIEEGNFDVMLTSPEMILGEKGKRITSNKSFQEKVCLLAFDESHCITEWGDEFRPKYKEVSRIRSNVTNAPVLMLTATTTARIMSSIQETLMLKHQAVEVIAVVPDRTETVSQVPGVLKIYSPFIFRPNVRLNIENAKDFESTLEWYIARLRSDVKDSPKAIIYCKSLKDVSEIYTYMMFKVGEKAWLSSQRRAHMKIIDMYHSALLSEDQQRITLEFTKENSNIRCVIATIAFGLGVDVRDIKYIFHWGPSKSPLQYWQEVGRCSRNGERGECYMYITPRSLDPRRCDDAMVKVIRSDQCLRVAVLEHLVVPGMDVSRLEALRKRKSCTAGCFKCICPLCVCCSRCSASCGCNSPN